MVVFKASEHFYIGNNRQKSGDALTLKLVTNKYLIVQIKGRFANSHTGNANAPNFTHYYVMNATNQGF